MDSSIHNNQKKEKKKDFRNVLVNYKPFVIVKFVTNFLSYFSP